MKKTNLYILSVAIALTGIVNTAQAQRKDMAKGRTFISTLHQKAAERQTLQDSYSQAFPNLSRIKQASEAQPQGPVRSMVRQGADGATRIFTPYTKENGQRLLGFNTDAQIYGTLVQSDSYSYSDLSKHSVALITANTGNVDIIWNSSTVAEITPSIAEFNRGIVYEEPAGSGTLIWRNIECMLGDHLTGKPIDRLLMMHSTYDVGNFLTGQLISSQDCLPNSDPLLYSIPNLALDPTTQLVWGIFDDENSPHGTLDVINMPKNMNNRAYNYFPTRRDQGILMDRLFVTISFDKKGQLYGICDDGSLYKIDKLTGEVELVGPTGIDFVDGNRQFFNSASAYDPFTEHMYWSVVTNEPNPNIVGSTKCSGLWDIDLKTGAADRLCIYPDNEIFDMLYIKSMGGSDLAAPGPVQDLTYTNYPEIYNKGDIRFLAPDTLLNGQSAGGGWDPEKMEIVYTMTVKVVMDDSIQVYSQSTGHGTMWDYEPVGYEGYHKITAYAENEAGRGPSTSIFVWMGKDSWAAPTDVTLKISDDGKASLKWRQPTKGAHGGTVGGEDAVARRYYRVVRQPEGIVVADNLQTNKFEENIDMQSLRYCYYDVIAVNPINTKTDMDYTLYGDRQMDGPAGSSNKIKLGEYVVPPVKYTFDTEDDWTLFSVLNLNKDEKAWFYQNKGHIAYWGPCIGTQNTENDDWVITSPIMLRKGYLYSLDYRLVTGYWNSQNGWVQCQYEQDYECVLLDDPDPDFADLYENLTEMQKLKGRYDKFYYKQFTVDEDGLYYIGWHKTFNAGTGAITITDITIDVEASRNTPAALENVTMKPGEKGALKADITFTTPTKTYGGFDLNGLSKVEFTRDGEVIGNIEAPETGREYTFTDENPTNGLHRYGARAYNEYGAGLLDFQEIYVGLDVPQGSAHAWWIDPYDGETLILQVDPCPEVGENGGYVDPATTELVLYTYNVLQSTMIAGNSVMGKDQISVNVKTNGANRHGSHLFGRRNAVGHSKYYGSPYYTVGKPTTEAITESFGGTYFDSGDGVWYPTFDVEDNWWMYSPNDGEWSIYEEFSQDDRGHSLAVAFNKGNDIASLNTWKISVKDWENPVISFWHYAYPGDPIKMGIEVNRGQKNTTAQEVYDNLFDWETETGQDEWKQCIFDLRPYKDEEYIIIYIDVIAGNLNGTGAFLDNIQIVDNKELADAAGVRTPEIVDLNDDNSVYTVDGKLVARGKSVVSLLKEGVYVVRSNTTGATRKIVKK